MMNLGVLTHMFEMSPCLKFDTGIGDGASLRKDHKFSGVDLS